jgi:hypothetical protein
VDEIEIRFTESEIADVLWVLYEAVELADQIDALASRAQFERVYRLVRQRFDERQP